MDRIIVGTYEWTLEWVPGSRLADIYHCGHVVDCVQVRPWDFSKGPLEQEEYVPTVSELLDHLGEFVKS